MTWRAILQVLGVLLLIDGVLAVILGKTYLRPWRALPGSAGRAIDSLLSLPGFTIRLIGLGESALGLRTLGAVPLESRRVYKHAAGWYDRFRELCRLALFEEAEEAVDQAVALYLPPGGKVLDLGCGTGANLERIVRLRLHFGSYTGLDLSPEMLAVARRRFAYVPTAKFIELDLEREPIPDGDYDLVISTLFLPLIRDPRSVVDKAMAKTKAGGYAILLFTSASGTWLDRLSSLMLAPFSARAVSHDVFLTSPGMVNVRRFRAGLITLVVLANIKPSELIE